MRDPKRFGGSANRDNLKRLRQDADAVQQLLMNGALHSELAEVYGVSVATMYRYFPATIVNQDTIEKYNGSQSGSDGS